MLFVFGSDCHHGKGAEVSDGKLREGLNWAAQILFGLAAPLADCVYADYAYPF
jgi:hypothetical protein